MSEYEMRLREGWTGTLAELSRRRYILACELHRRYGSMPASTPKQRMRKVFKFVKYSSRYPHGIAHPELFEE